jgi:7,8-dihydropterin-6-yl-methyl-4-(beta-D-ribofuranosyl)aminobenzene 5'-phosphate synthase
LCRDNQALIINVAGHGLVVLTGCGHAGIVSIVRPIVNPTVDALAAIGAKAVLPAHCTGCRAAHALARAMRLSRGPAT